MKLSLYQRSHFLGRGLCSGSSTLVRVPEKCLRGRGVGSNWLGLGERKSPSCLKATIHDRNEAERFGRELARSASESNKRPNKLDACIRRFIK
jgi:hypothetical protein